MANESPAARAARLAERKKVDEYYAKGQAERAAKQRQKVRQYPWSIHVMGQGMKNLYDVLRGEEIPDAGNTKRVSRPTYVDDVNE